MRTDLFSIMRFILVSEPQKCKFKKNKFIARGKSYTITINKIDTSYQLTVNQLCIRETNKYFNILNGRRFNKTAQGRKLLIEYLSKYINAAASVELISLVEYYLPQPIAEEITPHLCALPLAHYMKNQRAV